jgi:hypothetical protein
MCGSPVRDLADLLSYLLTPVGDDEGHPCCRLTLSEPGSVYPGALAPPRMPPAWSPPAHRHRVLQLPLSLPEAGNEEAAAGSPEQAFQGHSFVGLHSTCQKAASQELEGGSNLPPRLAQPGHPSWKRQETPRRRGRGSELWKVLDLRGRQDEGRVTVRKEHRTKNLSRSVPNPGSYGKEQESAAHSLDPQILV